jgi:hypothetical protein
MANEIIQVTVTREVATEPDNLQRKGMFLTTGGTTTAAQTATLLTSVDSLTAILKPAVAVTAASWTSNVVTFTAAGHDEIVGNKVVVAGMTPSAYNGTYTITVVSGNDIKAALTSDPGTATVMGTVQDYDAVELAQMNTTFWAQGSAVPVKVLELGNVGVSAAVTALTTYRTNNPGTAYAYLVPRNWASNADYVTLVTGLCANTDKIDFFTTVTSDNFASFDGLKSVFALVESASKASTEFTAAFPFYNILMHDLSPVSKQTPSNYAYGLSVTAYGGTPAERLAWRTANVSYIDTGAEGGITNKMLRGGRMGDGKTINYWYAVDWAQLQTTLALANEIIKGANDSAAPLYYDQDGIDRLVNRLKFLFADWGVQIGIIDALPQNGKNPALPYITAVPYYQFLTYYPAKVAAGTYDKLSVTFRVKGFFDVVTVNLTVTDFATI